MTTTATVLPGDTLGALCARHQLSREAFFALNPHKRVLRLASQHLTTELTEGESVRVGTSAAPGAFEPINEARYRTMQACFKEGKLVDVHADPVVCAPIYADGDQRYIVTDGERVDIPYGEEPLFLMASKCMQAGGIPDPESFGQCLRTGTVDGVFGYFPGDHLPIEPVDPNERLAPSEGPGAEEEKEKGTSAATWALGAAGLGLVGLAVWWAL